MDSDRGRFRYPTACRVRRRSDYLEIYRRGRRARTETLTLFALPNDAASSRLGVTVTRKVGGAVVRNRTKRLLKEIFRRHRERLDPHLDLVVNAHREIVGCGFAQIEKDFLKAFERVTRRR